ncbi:MAG: PilZ domain-containing protein [Pseudomonadota bacterium]
MPRRQKGVERRRQERREIELNVDLATYGKYYLSKLKNISIGGAFLLARELPPVGSEVKVRFRLPDEETAIEASGNVVWTYLQEGTREPNSTGMGIRFADLKDEDRDRIARFIEISSK